MRDFLEARREDLIEVTEPVSPRFEAPERAARTDGTILFYDVDGKRAVMNLLSSREALAEAVGVPLPDLVPHLASLRYEGKVREAGTIGMEEPDLSCLPVMTHYPHDAGPYITAGIVFSRYGGVENAAVHRMLVLDRKRVVVRLVEGRHTHALYKRAMAAGERLPIAVAIGVHPLVLFAASTRVPEGRELPFAAELLGGEIEVRTCPNGVRVPDAEIILEGYITPELVDEGPFVDITGTYDPVRKQPVIEFTGMWTKPDHIYHAILPAGMEHKLLMGAPYEPVIYRAVAGVTGVRNVHLTPGGAGYLHAVVQIEKRTEGDAKNAIMAAFAAHTSLKHVVVVDPDIEITDPSDVEYAIATRVRGDRDILIIPGVRGSSLDPMRIADGLNVKVGVDATMPHGREREFLRAEWED
ncbi:MAG: UbiD family decarboxylase [Methanoculleaceae archaeon]